ncbi:MAG: helix-turn-helix transcriptional regulator [Rickettsiales bacterium]|jgi:transcriptional regulator with XRE-family HTH domain|nr:helix-turn-helix transcriptional regulator [Rickettsiales bacterium]
MGRQITDDEIQFNKALGLVIRVARIKLGVSQKILGEVVGVSLQQIQKYEAGEDGVSVARFNKMATYLEIPFRIFEK